MPPTESSIPVTISLVSLHPDDIKSITCPACDEVMELHQPDSGLPERMLWTCEHCGTWFLMDIIPEAAEAVLVCLPDGDFFRGAVSR